MYKSIVSSIRTLGSQPGVSGILDFLRRTGIDGRSEKEKGQKNKEFHHLFSFSVFLSVLLSSLIGIIILSVSFIGNASAVSYPSTTPPNESSGGTFNTYFTNMYGKLGILDNPLTPTTGCPYGLVVRGFTNTGMLLCASKLVDGKGNYPFILSYAYNGTPANGIKIKTNIPYADSIGMPTIIIQGFDYHGGQTIGLLINWYVWAGNFYSASSMSSYGGYTPVIKLANEGGKIIIFIDDKRYFDRFTVSAYDYGIAATPTMYEGWSAADEPLTGTNVYTLPYKNNFAGRVGVGTMAPQGMLHVSVGAGLNGIVVSKDGGYNSEGNNAVRLVDSSYGTALQMGADPANNIGYIQAMQPWASWSTRNLILQGNGGNVGIGTTNPQAKLDVNGDMKVGDIWGGVAGGTRAIWKFDNNWPNHGIFYTEGTPDFIDFSPNGGGTGSSVMRVSGNGIVNIGTANYLSLLNVNGSGIILRNRPPASGYGYTMIRPVNGQYNTYGVGLAFDTFNYNSGSYALDESMRISDIGNVGIGTNDPSTAKLFISHIGAAKASSDDMSTKALVIQNTNPSTPTNSGFLNRIVYANANRYSSAEIGTIQTKDTNEGDILYLSTKGQSGVGPGVGRWNTNQLILHPSGNVGIGTINPQATLEVSGSVSVGQASGWGINNIGAGSQLFFNGSVGGNTDPLYMYRYNSLANSTELRMVIGDDSAGAAMDKFIIGTTPGDAVGTGPNFAAGFSPQFTVTSAGNVGIGTANPAEKLEIVDNNKKIGFAPSWIDEFTHIQSYQSPGNFLPLSIDFGDKLKLNANNGTGIIIMSAKNVGIGTNSPQNKLTIGSNDGVGYAISANSTTPYGLNLITNESAPSSNPALWVRTSTDNNTTFKDLFRVQNNGNIGVGIVNPAKKLDVVGDVQADQFCIRSTGECVKTFQQAYTNIVTFNKTIDPSIGTNADGSPYTDNQKPFYIQLDSTMLSRIGLADAQTSNWFNIGYSYWQPYETYSRSVWIEEGDTFAPNSDAFPAGPYTRNINTDPIKLGVCYFPVGLYNDLGYAVDVGICSQPGVTSHWTCNTNNNYCGVLSWEIRVVGGAGSHCTGVTYSSIIAGYSWGGPEVQNPWASPYGFPPSSYSPASCGYANIHSSIQMRFKMLPWGYFPAQSLSSYIATGGRTIKVGKMGVMLLK